MCFVCTYIFWECLGRRNLAGRPLNEMHQSGLLLGVEAGKRRHLDVFWLTSSISVFGCPTACSIAVMTKALSHASGESELETELHKIASWALFACGVVYIVSVSDEQHWGCGVVLHLGSWCTHTGWTD